MSEAGWMSWSPPIVGPVLWTTTAWPIRWTTWEGINQALHGEGRYVDDSELESDDDE